MHKLRASTARRLCTHITLMLQRGRRVHKARTRPRCRAVVRPHHTHAAARPPCAPSKNAPSSHVACQLGVAQCATLECLLAFKLRATISLASAAHQHHRHDAIGQQHHPRCGALCPRAAARHGQPADLPVRLAQPGAPVRVPHTALQVDIPLTPVGCCRPRQAFLALEPHAVALQGHPRMRTRSAP